MADKRRIDEGGHALSVSQLRYKGSIIEVELTNKNSLIYVSQMLNKPMLQGYYGITKRIYVIDAGVVYYYVPKGDKKG